MLTTDQVFLVNTLSELATKERSRVFLVGGAVRDIFLGHDIADKDLDFIIEGDALTFARLCGEVLGGEVKEFKTFLTAKVLQPQRTPTILEVDLASARKEIYESPGSLPKVTRGTVEEDLKRRDFTINAFAVPLAALLSWVEQGNGDLSRLYKETIDFYGGRDDLQQGLIRVLHQQSFSDDPTRIFRACRYATRINATIEPETLALLKAAVEQGALQTVSTFRKLNELKIVFSEARPDLTIELLATYGVFIQFPLYQERQEAEVFQSLRELARLPIRRSQEFLYHVALGVFYRYFESSKRNDQFRTLGFGKKFIKKLEVDLVNAIEGCNSGEFSDEGLVMSLIWDGASTRRDELYKEAYRRKIFLSPR